MIMNGTLINTSIPYSKEKLDKLDITRAMYYNIENIRKSNEPLENKLLLLQGVVDMAWALGAIDWNTRFEIIGRFVCKVG